MLYVTFCDRCPTVLAEAHGLCADCLEAVDARARRYHRRKEVAA